MNMNVDDCKLICWFGSTVNVPKTLALERHFARALTMHARLLSIFEVAHTIQGLCIRNAGMTQNGVVYS